MRKFFILSLFSVLLVAQSHTVQVVGSNLMWENSIHSRDIKLTYQEAVTYCKNIKTDSFQDWRVPTLEELLNLVNYKKVNPAITKEITLLNQKKMYWSSTPYLNNSNSFWGVRYNDGSTQDSSDIYERYIRCVRTTKEAKKEAKDAEPKKVVKG